MCLSQKPEAVCVEELNVNMLANMAADGAWRSSAPRLMPDVMRLLLGDTPMLSSRMAASVLVATIGAISLGARPAAQASAVNASDSAQAILQRYADAWRGGKEMEVPGRLVLAFSVHGDQGGEYALELSNDPGGIVRQAAPATYDIGFEVDIDFLRRLDRGEMGALTAMGQARSSDPIPLNPRFGPDFGKRPEAPLLFRRLGFHFWNRGWARDHSLQRVGRP